MYRTRQFHVKKNSRLYDYCRTMCRNSAILYNRANYILRQFATALDSFDAKKPLYSNQMEVYHLVMDILGRTKYLRGNKWLSYSALDRILKVTKDKAYYALPAQANQQTLKLLIRDYGSFFCAIKAYQNNASAFTGKPRLPGYIKDKGLKTAILTNQICVIKEERFLKLPGIRVRLNLGKGVCGTLKEVRIKPACGRFVIDVVLQAKDAGIIPEDNDKLLEELQAVESVDDIRVMAIDPGTENIIAAVNNFGNRPFVIKGGIIKSINQYYNKELARLSSAARRCNDRYRTKRMDELTGRRNRRIKDCFHKISRELVDYAKSNQVDVVVMGHNVSQKQGIHIGHVNNQNFVQIPMAVLAGMLRYKLAANGIKFVLTEESYTSKADFLAGDEIPEYRKEDGEKRFFSGRRISRGLYKHYDGIITNADINGAGNILRKVFPKVTQWDRGIVDMPCSAGSKGSAGSCREAA